MAETPGHFLSEIVYRKTLYCRYSETEHFMTKRVAFYLRVSTGEQSTELQRADLTAVAERAGWQIVEIYEDAGFSGKNGREKRPAFDRLLKDATRRKFDILAVWAVDRLGRSLKDLVTTLHELQATGIDLYVNKQAIDTTTPAGKALFGMLGVFAEFERDLIVERVKAGIARHREKPRPGKKPIGRPSCDAAAIRAELDRGTSLRKTAAKLNVALSTVQKAKASAAA
jgi:DNA invertase Pin-like site-specific DNA recombinase